MTIRQNTIKFHLENNILAVKRNSSRGFNKEEKKLTWGWLHDKIVFTFSGSDFYTEFLFHMFVGGRRLKCLRKNNKDKSQINIFNSDA